MARRTKTTWIKWIIVLLLLGGAAYGGWRWYGKRTKDESVEYKTAGVSCGDLVQQVTADGPIKAGKNVAVGSQVSGLVTEIKVDFNSRVTNGQIIAQIDPSTYQQNITQADAELANAEIGRASCR